MSTQRPKPSTFSRGSPRFACISAQALGAGVLATSVACTAAHGDPVSQAEPASEAHRIHADEAGGEAGDQAGGEAGGEAGCEALPAAVGATYIVFDSDRDQGNRDLYLIRADGSGLRRLTKGKGAEREAVFSPDGGQLAYVSDSPGTAQIYIFDFATGKSRQLTQEKAGADQPSWFPDGKRLAFHSGASVFMIGADGSDEQLVGTGTDDFNAFKNPAVSVRGDEVLVDRNNEINAINIQTGDMRHVIRNWTVHSVEPAVSRDGEHMAYSVSCSASGRQIVMTPFLADNLVPCEGTVVTAPDTGFSAEDPAWGPESYLAYERVQSLGRTGPMGTETFGWSRIVVIARGEEACELEESNARDQNPSWAPEGFALPDDFSPL